MVSMSPRVQAIIGQISIAIITVPHTCRNKTWSSLFFAHGCFIILCTDDAPELECNREGCVLGAHMRAWFNSDVTRASRRLRPPASQLPVATVCSTACSDKEQRQYKSPALLVPWGNALMISTSMRTAFSCHGVILDIVCTLFSRHWTWIGCCNYGTSSHMTKIKMVINQ